jgi:hypothetical protein
MDHLFTSVLIFSSQRLKNTKSWINTALTDCTNSPSKLPKDVGINCVSPDMDVWLTFGGLGRPFESVSNLSISMRNNNFVGAARREIQEGGFAVEPSLLVGCGLKTHDVNPNEVWTSY